jgi:dolichyl-diphosphooligosaccharide---protein glycosyltransferase
MFSLKCFWTCVLQAAALAFALYSAYTVRMHAINIYGLVIHEFDPWFNFRATQYLADNGLSKFFKWYDYMSWSPLGRPVGTTIYPGMQMLAVFLWQMLNKFGLAISLNDVCCYVPVWGGMTATFLLGLLTYIASGSRTSGVLASLVMSIIPAHIMRSVGGGYDNESVAISALCLTFVCWMYSLTGPDKKGSLFGILTGLAYVCMVATWGGYIFLVNLIGLHAFLLVAMGRFSNKLYWAYTTWYIIGTLGAIQVPVVGWTPLKSLEQMAPLGVFGLMQLLQLCEQPAFLKLFKVDADTITSAQRFKVRSQVFTAAAVGASVVVAVLWPTGYFGPLSSRVRGLFVTHTRTGNPLVDSVAEHQPASPQAFWQFLHYACHTAPIGFVIVLFSSVIKPFFKPPKEGDRSTDAMVFLVVYAVVSYHFSTKMNRLMLLMGPISASLTGIALNLMYSFVWDECSSLVALFSSPTESAVTAAKDSTKTPAPSSAQKSSKKGKTPSSSSASSSSTSKRSSSSSPKADSITAMIEQKVEEVSALSLVKFLRKVVALFILYLSFVDIPEFYAYSHAMSGHLSSPSIMFQARLNDGTTIMVDDYREAYWWLRDNTPEDSRVMAWWDYGYQITGIANRTSIADGNTWNHEHIALLGRCLTSPEKRAHKIIKHLADYVLIWSGGGGDDLAKSPHMARIGNSVFNDICPGDPLCQEFGFYNRQMDPTPMMEESLLYKLHRNRERAGVMVDPTLFKERFMSKYGKVRIYEVVGVSEISKNWTASPENRVCDAPGSWYCEGQYPPALNKLLSKAKNFAQLEDFNVKKDSEASKYHEEYMKKMRAMGQ